MKVVGGRTFDIGLDTTLTRVKGHQKVPLMHAMAIFPLITFDSSQRYIVFDENQIRPLTTFDAS